MAPTAAERKQEALILKRATLEQALRICRMELKEAAAEVMKERKAAAKAEVAKKAAKFMGKSKVREGLHKCEKTGGMVGLSKDGKIRYGPGHHCWQCMHRARKGKGGHKHTCGKKPYAR